MRVAIVQENTVPRTPCSHCGGYEHEGGRGWNGCPVCGGDAAAAGSGIQTCPYCYGSGYRRTDNAFAGCTQCGGWGEGTLTEIIKGSGKIPCTNCRSSTWGAGKLNCMPCDGTGWINT